MQLFEMRIILKQCSCEGNDYNIIFLCDKFQTQSVIERVLSIFEEKSNPSMHNYTSYTCDEH